MADIGKTLDIIVDTITQMGSPDKIILFGSQARGDFHEDSDIDIMIIEDADRKKSMAYRLAVQYAFRKNHTHAALDILTTVRRKI